MRWLFGSHAVNAYVEPATMTADVDTVSIDAHGVARDLQGLLSETFHIVLRVRSAAQGRGFRGSSPGKNRRCSCRMGRDAAWAEILSERVEPTNDGEW
jgi:hypothetical protein